MKLFVGNLPFSATEADIREFFGTCGEIADLQIPLDRETGRARGFAFVTLADRDAGETAIRDLNGSQLGGRSLRISEAIERERPPRGAGGGGGGRGDHRRGGGGRDRGRDRDRDRW